MSMYSLAFGATDMKIPILTLVGIDPGRIGRFRDVWFERTGDPEALHLAIYTRNGGGNRDDYDEEIQYLHGLPGFVSDSDDSFDSTYATFRVRITRESFDAAACEALKIEPDDAWRIFGENAADAAVDTDARWREAIDALGKS